MADLLVEVWDWQDDINDVTLTSDYFDDASPDSDYPGTTAHSRIFEFNDVEISPEAVGELEMMVTVEDSKTFGEYWFRDKLPPDNPMYGENLYNCFLTTLDVEQGVVWHPEITLVGGNPKARAISTDNIEELHSTYDKSSTFNVTGVNAEGGTGPYTYQCYVSTSDTSATGSLVGWVDFTFDGGGSCGIDWGDYASIAPDYLYVWTHAVDGEMSSAPEKCSTEMLLARVCYETPASYPFGSWYIEWNGGISVSSQANCAYFSCGSHGFGVFYSPNVNFGSSGENTIELYSYYIDFQSPSFAANFGAYSSPQEYPLCTVGGYPSWEGVESCDASGFSGNFKNFIKVVNYYDGAWIPVWYVYDCAVYENPV